MQIRSDDQQFQQLDDCHSEIKDSVRGPPEQKQRRANVRVEIRQAGNANEKNLLENQYYSITVLRDEKQITRDIKRRFSDFDMLFEILCRQYKGYILPAFPQNGILSYVKSKVSLAKDDKYLKERISMVQRFLTLLLNEPSFYEENSPQIRAFLSEKEFDLFKKKQKEKIQGIFTTSWNKIMGYMKISKQGKYKIIEQQLLTDKIAFEQLYKKAKCIVQLLQQQKQQCMALQAKNLAITSIAQYFARQKLIIQQQEANLIKMRKLEFDLYCQNEDYIMVMKLLKNMQDLKNNEQNYSFLDKAERNFNSQYLVFKSRKKDNIKKLKNGFDQLLKDISKTDAKF